jgi:electron transport complex protein RnfB
MAQLTGYFQRTIPVQQSVEVSHHVAPYDDACDILRNQNIIVLTDCACRRQRAMFGKGCGKPMEVCFMFGPMGEYYAENGLGRRIGAGEAIEVLTRAQEAGLVTQPATAHNPFTLCSCCGDCCGFLHAINKYAKPAEFVSSNYALAVEAEKCSGCGKCAERCWMRANELNDAEVAEFNPDRCIGCGLCVMTCPEKARVLVLKPDGLIHEPPAGTVGQMTDLARRRGLQCDDPSRIVSFGFEK